MSQIQLLILQEQRCCPGTWDIVEDMRTFFAKTKEFFRIPLFRKGTADFIVAEADSRTRREKLVGEEKFLPDSLRFLRSRFY